MSADETSTTIGYMHKAFAFDVHGFPKSLRALVIVFLINDFYTLLISILAFSFTVAYISRDEQWIGCGEYRPTDWLSASFALTIISEITYVVVMIILLIISLARGKSGRILYRARLHRWLHLWLVFSRIALIIALLGLLRTHAHFWCTRQNVLEVREETAIYVLSIMQVIGCFLWLILRWIIITFWKIGYAKHNHDIHDNQDNTELDEKETHIHTDSILEENN